MLQLQVRGSIAAMLPECFHLIQQGLQDSSGQSLALCSLPYHAGRGKHQACLSCCRHAMVLWSLRSQPSISADMCQGPLESVMEALQASET